MAINMSVCCEYSLESRVPTTCFYGALKEIILIYHQIPFLSVPLSHLNLFLTCISIGPYRCQPFHLFVHLSVGPFIHLFFGTSINILPNIHPKLLG